MMLDTGLPMVNMRDIFKAIVKTQGRIQEFSTTKMGGLSHTTLLPLHVG